MLFEKLITSAIFIHLVLTAGALILLPVVLLVSVRKQLTDEILLYQVRGPYTFFNVKLWLQQIENHQKVKFNSVYKKLELFQANAERSGIKFGHYKDKIEKMMFSIAFGKQRRKTALSRMLPLTRSFMLTHLAIFFLPLFYAVLFWVKNAMEFDIAYFFGSVFCIAIVGCVFWVFSFIIINRAFVYTEYFMIKSRGEAGYLHIVTAQIAGYYKGIWPRNEVPAKAIMELSDIVINQKGESEIIFFERQKNKI